MNESPQRRRRKLKKSTLQPGVVVGASEDLELKVAQTLQQQRALVIHGFTMTTAQRVALENPQTDDERGAFMQHSGDPRFRDVEMVTLSDADLVKVRSLGWEGTERRRLQLVSILTVDLESPPVWHASVGWVYNPEDRWYPKDQWTREMLKKASERFLELIPGLHLGRMCHRAEWRGEGGAQGGKGKATRMLYCHIRSPLNKEERIVAESMQRSGIIVPRFLH